MALGTLGGTLGGSFPAYGAQILSFKTMALAGSATSVKCPSVVCSMVNIMAPKSNTGGVFIGPDTSVTVEAGTTNYTAGWELEPSQQTGWLPVSNLDIFSYICDNATDDLLVFVV